MSLVHNFIVGVVHELDEILGGFFELHLPPLLAAVFSLDSLVCALFRKRRQIQNRKTTSQ